MSFVSWHAMKIIAEQVFGKNWGEKTSPCRKAVVAISAHRALFGNNPYLPARAVHFVIPVGLAILATEFVWAQRWLQRWRNLISKTQWPLQGGKSAAVQTAIHPRHPPARNKIRCPCLHGSLRQSVRPWPTQFARDGQSHPPGFGLFRHADKTGQIIGL